MECGGYVHSWIEFIQLCSYPELLYAYAQRYAQWLMCTQITPVLLSGALLSCFRRVCEPSAVNSISSSITLLDVQSPCTTESEIIFSGRFCFQAYAAWSAHTMPWSFVSWYKVFFMVGLRRSSGFLVNHRTCILLGPLRCWTWTQPHTSAWGHGVSFWSEPGASVCRGV